MVGTTLAGRYSLGEKIATGGMGTVYSATDSRLERTVAVKLLKEGLAEDPRFVERFRREARAAGALSHPNIAGVFDYGEDAGRHFIVMELVQGRDLARLLREEGPLSEERTARIAAYIADALAHAHAAGVVHRDVKPANAIIGPDDRVKVTDFGIARAQSDASLTATGSFMGTAQYISPEQASGLEVGPASDIYSLGIVTFEMVTGSVPYTGDSAVAVAMRHISDDVPAPTSLKPDVSPAMDALVKKATARDPEQRFIDANAFAAAARGVITGVETAPVVTAATTAALGGTPTATAVMSGSTRSQTAPEAWPFPAHPPRWDPRTIGRAVVAIFVILGVVAAALVVYRLAQSGDDASDSGSQTQERTAAAEQPTTEDEPTALVLPDVTDRNYEDAASVLSDMGLTPVREDTANEEYPEGVVFETSPPPGSEVEEGDTITLFVSTGSEESEEDEDIVPEDLEEDLPPGQEKKEDKDKDDD